MQKPIEKESWGFQRQSPCFEWIVSGANTCTYVSSALDYPEGNLTNNFNWHCCST